MIIKKKIKDITQTDMKIIQMMNKDFLPAGIKEGYLKSINVVMKCRTEEQLNNAGRYLRNYERLMQNSYLYPTIRKPLANRYVSNLLSLLRIKRKEYLDLWSLEENL